MIYLLTLFLWTGDQWVTADPVDFPPQEYDTIQECIQQKFYWNNFYGKSATEYIGVNRALCIEKKLF